MIRKWFETIDQFTRRRGNNFQAVLEEGGLSGAYPLSGIIRTCPAFQPAVGLAVGDCRRDMADRQDIDLRITADDLSIAGFIVS